MHGFQYDVVIDDIIDEVVEPQLRPVIIEAWREVVDVDRDKQVKKVLFRETLMIKTCRKLNVFVFTSGRLFKSGVHMSVFDARAS